MLSPPPTAMQRIRLKCLIGLKCLTRFKFLNGRKFPIGRELFFGGGPIATNLSQWSQRQPMTFLLIAVVVGVLADSMLPQAAAPSSSQIANTGSTIDSVAWRIWFWSGWIVGLGSLIFFGGKHCSQTTLATATLLMVGSFGGGNHCWQSHRYDAASILRRIDAQPQPAIVRGKMDGVAQLRRHPFASQRQRENLSPWQTTLTVSLTQIRSGVDFHPIDGRLQVIVNGNLTHAKPGDDLELYGSIRGIGRATNPGEPDFAGYYRGHRLHGQMQIDSVQQVFVSPTNAPEYWFARWIADLSARGRTGLLESMDERTGPIAVALVLGQRDFVDLETRDQLLVTGTAHLLSVSGMHLAIVVGMTVSLSVLLQLPMPAKFFLVASVCLFYCAITGARPPVMRAAVLVMTLLVAMWLRRPSQIMNTLSLAGLILVLSNPQNVFNAGVQLSFLAVATLVLSGGNYFHGRTSVDQTVQQENRLMSLAQSSWPRWITFTRRWGVVLGQLCWASLCVTTISLPIVWYYFNVVSLVSVPTNVALSPLLVVSLASGIVTAACAVLLPSIAFVPAAVCQASLSIMRWIIDVGAGVPMGHIWLPAPPVSWVIVFYLGIAASLMLPRDRTSRWVRIGWIGGWIAIAWMIATTRAELPDDVVEATFIDVGHGTSVVLRSGDDVWLYDCGRLGNDVGSSRDIDGVLWSLGVTRLDGILLSHADSDHFNALPGLIRRFAIDRIVTPPGMLDEPETALDDIRAAIRAADLPVVQISRGEAIAGKSVTMQVLHPPAIRIDGSDNANSLVVRIDIGGRSLLLPGDLEPPGTDVLLAQPRPAPGGVLMAPHHGSLRMDAGAVLDWGRPSQTIVSGGRRAAKPEVTDILASRGSGVHVTFTDGAIRVRMDSQGEIHIRRFADSSW